MRTTKVPAPPTHPREVVAGVEAEGAGEDLHDAPHPQGVRGDVRDFHALEEAPGDHAIVPDLGLHDLAAVVLQVVQQQEVALAGALQGGLGHALLEVAPEGELQPRQGKLLRHVGRKLLRHKGGPGTLGGSSSRVTGSTGLRVTHSRPRTVKGQHVTLQGALKLKTRVGSARGAYQTQT